MVVLEWRDPPAQEWGTLEEISEKGAKAGTPRLRTVPTDLLGKTLTPAF